MIRNHVSILAWAPGRSSIAHVALEGRGPQLLEGGEKNHNIIVYLNSWVKPMECI
jgi:hypothetical protein